MGTFHFVTGIVVLSLTRAAPTEDLIVNLPGLDYAINFNHYSGYLNGTEGRHLHYWFTESQNDPLTDPLVLWLNGGPGCSSLAGLLTENGPYFTKPDGSGLQENPYSWNLIANVLFLESPACVGFSYDDNSTCKTGDNEVAEMNYLALQHFHQKFPEYRNREFFITGESYAGIYIPTLSQKIVEGNATYPFNFQGFAIGNGLLSYVSNQNSLMFYGYYHGLLGEELWGDLVDRCCEGIGNQDNCNFFLNISALCEASVLKATNIMYYSGLNMYNLYSDCETPAGEQESRYTYDKKNIFFNSKFQRPELFADPPCTDSTAETTYLNNPDVRTALHIPSFVGSWEICSREVSLRYIRTVYNVSSQLMFLRDNSIRGLIYNGDVDMACNVIGNEWDVDLLNYPITESRRKWMEGDQVAGYVTVFDLLDFVTVKGSGHMVPTDKPVQALHMITSFIKDEPY